MTHVCFWFTQGLFNNIDRAGKGFLVFKVIKFVAASMPPGTFQAFAAASRPPQNISGFILITAQQLRAASAWLASCNLSCASVHGNLQSTCGCSLHV